MLPFVPTTDTNANITTTFFIDVDDDLHWTNAVFDNGAARFCNTTSGSILAVFHGDLPNGCINVTLTFAPRK